MSGEAVKLYIYDMSKGVAGTFSLVFLGKQIDGVWHTGIVIYGQEFFFGPLGIESCPPTGTGLGRPDVIHDLGHTQIPYVLFMHYLQDLSSSTFRPEHYDVLEYNCNTFSSELARFLTGKTIPSHITNLPAAFLSTLLGRLVKPFVNAISVGRSLFTSKTGPPREPVTYKVTVQQMLEQFKTSREQVLKDHPRDGSVVTEVMDCVSSENCTWAQGRQKIQTLGAMVLNSEFDQSTRCLAGSLLQVAALQEDVVMAAQHDPKRSVQKFLGAAELVSEQLLSILSKMVVNFVSSNVGHKFLSSEAAVSLDTGMSTNLKLMIHVCVRCLLNKQAEFWEIGAAAVTNLVIHGVSEDTAVELSSAVLQCMTKDLSENTANLLLWSIVQLMKKSEKVRRLTATKAVDWSKFSTSS